MRALVLVSFLFLQSCAMFKSIYDHWDDPIPRKEVGLQFKGKTKEVIIKENGFPTQTMTLNGKELWSYKKGGISSFTTPAPPCNSSYCIPAQTHISSHSCETVISFENELSSFVSSTCDID